MRGRHIGHLKIYEYFLAPSESIPGGYQHKASHLLWGVVGEQSIFWQYGKVQIPALDGKLKRRLIIEAFDWAEGRAGNIVLDDIRYVKNAMSCTLRPSWAAPPEPTTARLTTTTTTVYETTGQVTFTETEKVPKRLTTPLPVYTTSTEIDETTSQFRLYESTTVTNTSVNFQATAAIYTSEEPDGTTSETTHLSVTSKPTPEVSAQTTLYTYMTTKSGRIGTINPTTRMDRATPKTGGGVTAGNSRGQTYIWIIVGVGGFLIVLVIVFVIYCCRLRRKKKFEYYDNHTVHMTRIAGEDAKETEGDMQYEKFT